MSKKTKWYQIKALANGNTEIYVYDEIGYWGVTAKDFARDLKEVGKGAAIDLHINSPGGSVTDGIAIYNLLKNHQNSVNIIIDGIAASMASVIAMAGDTITMPENALMMIHNPWGGAMGDADEMRKTADVLDKMKTALISAYASKTGLGDEEISAMMDAETWMTGAEAAELGFADQTSAEVKIAASFDTTKLNNFNNPLIENLTQPSAYAETNQEEPSMSGTKTPSASKPAAGDNVDLEAVEKQAIADYKAKQAQRKESIKTTFGVFAESQGELLQACLDDEECTPIQASEQLLKALGQKQEPLKGGHNVSVYASNGQIVKDTMTAALVARSGLKMGNLELSNDNPYRGMTLMEMARASLTDKGVGTASFGDRMALVGAAFTHGNSDFGNILADVANKAMLTGFEEAEETFQAWTRQGNLSDFKINKRVALNDMASLPEVRPGAEFQYGTIGDRGENIALATYGQLVSLNRQTIINDDLGAFVRVLQVMGDAAIRTVGDLVYAVLTGNPAMSDGNTLFSSAHKNLRTSAGGALSVDSLSKARESMRKQKLDGKSLNIRPGYLIVPASLETTATTLMNDTVKPGASNNEMNPVSGMADVVTEARLDDDSSTAWYLAGENRYDGIEVAYLDGNPAPFLDQIDGFSVDGTTFKVRIDAGVSPLEYRSLYKSNGAA